MLWAIREGPLAADRLLHDPRVAGSLTAEQARELYLQAGRGAAAADAAFNRTWLERARRELPP